MHLENIMATYDNYRHNYQGHQTKQRLPFWPARHIDAVTRQGLTIICMHYDVRRIILWHFFPKTCLGEDWPFFFFFWQMTSCWIYLSEHFFFHFLFNVGLYKWFDTLLREVSLSFFLSHSFFSSYQTAPHLASFTQPPMRVYVPLQLGWQLNASELPLRAPRLVR